MRFTEKEIIEAAKSVHLERVRRGPSFFKLTQKGKTIWYLIFNNNAFQLTNKKSESCWWPTNKTFRDEEKKKRVNIVNYIISSKRFHLVSLNKMENEIDIDVVGTLIELKKKMQ